MEYGALLLEELRHIRSGRLQRGGEPKQQSGANRDSDREREYARVRADVKGLIEDITRNTSADVRMAGQVRRLEMPIIFFVDNVISTSRLKFAAQWAAMAIGRRKRSASAS